MKRSALGSSLVDKHLNQSVVVDKSKTWAKDKVSISKQAKLQDGGFDFRTFERWTLNGYRTKGLDLLELTGRQSRMM